MKDQREESSAAPSLIEQALCVKHCCKCFPYTRPFSPHNRHMVGPVIILSVQKKKVRVTEKKLVQDYTAADGEGRIQIQAA